MTDFEVRPALAEVEPGPSRRDGVFAFLVAIGGMAVAIGLSAPLVRAAKSLANDQRTLSDIAQFVYPPWWYIVATATAGIIGLGGAAAIVNWRWGLLRGKWQFRIRDFYYIGLGVPLVFFGIFLDLKFVSSQQVAPSNAWSVPDFSNSVPPAALVTPHWAYVLVAFVMLVPVPIVHEAFFRGALLGATRAITGISTWLVVSAVVVVVALLGCFYSAGFGFAFWPGLFLSNFILNWIVVRRGRLWPCVFTNVGFGLVFVALWYLNFSWV